MIFFRVLGGLLFAGVWGLVVAEAVTQYELEVRVLRPFTYAVVLVVPWICGVVLFMLAMVQHR